MKMHELLISVILVTLVIFSATTFIGDLGDHYSTTANFSGIMNYTNNSFTKMQNNSKELSNLMGFELEKDPTNENLFLPYKMIRIAWTGIKLIFNSWGVFADVTRGTIKEAGNHGVPIPAWLQVGLIAIIIIVMVSIILYAFFKWKFED